MKRVLLIDETDLFREYVANKLQGYGLDVLQAQNGLDGIVKLRQHHPDLIIMDYFLNRGSATDILEKKNADPNTVDVPVIMASAKMDKEVLLKLTHYGVKKIFTKPIKIDGLLKAISDALKINLEVDNTPCIIDANCNDDIIFVEVALGLNKDKIELLKYRLRELLDIYKLPEPKILLMMSGLEVGPNDSLQLASLISTIVDCSGAVAKNIKVLTKSPFVVSFVSARESYKGIKVVESIDQAMDDLLGHKAGVYKDIATGGVDAKLLAGSGNQVSDSGFNLKFEEDKVNKVGGLLNDLGSGMRVCIVDDDFVIRQIISKVFSATKCSVDSFEDGSEFVSSSHLKDYDLIFLDLMMPTMDGFQVLEHLKKQALALPIIILSALSTRETVVKALRFGVKSYIIKPVNPEGVYTKALDILRQNFR